MKAFLILMSALLTAPPVWADCRYGDFVRPPALEGTDVHLWIGNFSELPSDQSILSAEEKQRLARTLVEEKATEFEKSRVFLRGILSRYLSVEPAKVPLAVSSLGKPY